MGYRPVNINTVFIGHPSYRFNVKKKTCEFATPVQSFRCTQLLDNYSKAKCSEMGFCLGGHDSVTGVLIARKLNCEHLAT
jgi:hypothetical protein